MPKREDIDKILIIGSGPIIIGQAAEFDFSGSQAALSLREEGYEVAIVNSNPATFQTDKEMADRVYLEPLTLESVTRIIERERPDGILGGMGGQTGLNVVSELAEAGVLDTYDVEILGTPLRTIEQSEDRDLFKKLMEEIGEPVMKSDVASSIEDAHEIVKELGGYPVLVRPAYTLGGTGGGIAHNDEELETIVGRGLVYSRIDQVLVEESVLGWKEFEYEVMRDGHDNCLIVCNMENLDPMGVHTGESIVVAPSQTLSDDDHQILRSAAIKIIRALGVEGGCNIQLCTHPETGEYRVIEVNPRVSRSSALASKATGYPIARVAAKITVGMTLDEIPNSVTKETPASFEPALDYIVTKIPRWPFDKFRTVDRTIGTQMKSTGEAMGIGRNIEESLMKAVRSLDTGQMGMEPPREWSDEELETELVEATDERLYAHAEAIRRGWSTERITDLSGYDAFWVHKLRNLVEVEERLRTEALTPELMREAKRLGFPDVLIAEYANRTEAEVHTLRLDQDVQPAYKMVDTCAAEFAAKTPYYYSTYEDVVEAPDVAADTTPGTIPNTGEGDIGKVLVVGGGPIRIGQGIEFDYACVHAVQALREGGVEALMVNNNPETVSTDFDISDKLFFDPLTLEDILNLVEAERPDGVICQFGGQTSVNLAVPLQEALDRRPDLTTRVLGTSPASMDLAEDRSKFSEILTDLGIPQPEAGSGSSYEEVKDLAADIGYPVLVRPSYVLGGRAMEIVYDEEELEEYMREAARVSPEHPILVDNFLAGAVEIDVDAVSDGEDVIIGGIMEHVEEAGVHSGDSTCFLPPVSLSDEVLDTVRQHTADIARALGVKGLLNIQYAVKDGKVHVLEANPRASRTVPYVSKAVGIPLAKIATRVMLGERLADMDVPEPATDHVSVKAPVFPFLKLPGVDSILTPEMKSTGEVMGIDTDPHRAYYKAMVSAGMELPEEGAVYITVRDEHKDAVVPLAAKLGDLGFTVYATRGTAQHLRDHDVPCETAWRISEGKSPDAIDLMRRGDIELVINTPTETRGAKRDGYMMRRLAVELDIPFLTTLAAAEAAVEAIHRSREGTFESLDIATYHEASRGNTPPAEVAKRLDA